METATGTHDEPLAGRGEERPKLALCIAFASDGRTAGEVLLARERGRTYLVGRGPKDAEDTLPRLLPLRQRPGKNDLGPALSDAQLSRQQLRVESDGTRLRLENLGKRELLDAGGSARRELSLAPGEVAEIRGRLLLVCVERPPLLPAARSLGKTLHPFGEPDAQGFVGESPVAWKLRDTAAFVAARAAHVLLLGESGTGKEVVARMIHELSKRGSKRLVSRNAATLPEGLIDAELFGHVANYPNAGMPERQGLVAEADGGTLFLDEIGELGHELQTRLLRVMDERGEYQRLGDPRLRTSNFRLVAATNRPASALKHDIAARFRLRLTVPTLGERREDIPLVARHLLRRASLQDPEIGARFLEGWDGRSGEPRLSCELVRALVAHDYRTHVRELDALLWASLASSPAERAELTPEAREALDEVGERPSQAPRVDVRELTAETVRAALERAGGVHERAWKELGLANRHVLKRLVAKFGLRDDG